MDKQRVLIVDDEEGMLEVCQDTLAELADVEIETFRSSLKAVERLQQGHVDLLISDIRMPGLSGVDLLRTVRELTPHVQVLLMTGFPTVDTAIQALRLGAEDYLTKPFHPDELLETVRRVLRSLRLKNEHRLLARHLERDFQLAEMVGSSTKMREVFQLIDRIAATDAPVIISGETGTGKELVARAIHQLSPQAERRFVPVDCGAIPENLMESEFFGHEKGAFSGAEERTIGLLEYADSGTLFLDEVTELPLKLQAKLLRALQEKSFRRVGGNEEIRVDIRVLAATNQNLEELVKSGDFREDLFYRLNVLNIQLPALRERQGDIPLLISHFLNQSSTASKSGTYDIAQDAVEVLERFPWPGNVRQLQNVLKRAVALTSGDTIELSSLPESVVLNPQDEGSTKGAFFSERSRCINEFEARYLKSLLAACSGNVVQAAQQAGLPRGTIYRLFRRNNLNPKDFRDQDSE